jgi:hypothetical protein
MSEAMINAVWFVAWPDGKVLEESVALTSAEACAKAVRYWLPEQWFPGLELHSMHYGPLSPLWRAMERAGFKVSKLTIPQPIKSPTSEAEKV